MARPVRAGVEEDLDLDRRVAAGVEDLPPEDVLDAGHVFAPCCCCGEWGERYSCCQERSGFGPAGTVA